MDVLRRGQLTGRAEGTAQTNNLKVESERLDLGSRGLILSVPGLINSDWIQDITRGLGVFLFGVDYRN